MKQLLRSLVGNTPHLWNHLGNHLGDHLLSRRKFILLTTVGIIMGKYLTPHFSQAEMTCRGTGKCEMDEEFMELLERIRMEYGKGMIVTSGFRAPRYNQTISPKTGKTGPHTTGRAADILVAGPDAYALMQIAQSLGATGIGISQRGDHAKRFIHIDNLGADYAGPRPFVWSY